MLSRLKHLVRNAQLLATEDMPPSNSHGQRKIGQRPKSYATAVRNQKEGLDTIQRITHGGDEFFVVERFHEKCDGPDGHSCGARGQIFARSDDDHFSTR